MKKIYRVCAVECIENPLHQFSEKYANIEYFCGRSKSWRVVQNWDKRYKLLCQYIKETTQEYTEFYIR